MQTIQKCHPVIQPFHILFSSDFLVSSPTTEALHEYSKDFINRSQPIWPLDLLLTLVALEERTATMQGATHMPVAREKTWSKSIYPLVSIFK